MGADMTYNFPAGGGGGATAFTELTDAPATITANAVIVGNAAGDAVAFNAWLTAEDVGGTRVITFTPSAVSEDVQIATADAGNLELQASDNTSGALYGGSVTLAAGAAVDAAGGGAGWVYLNAGHASGTGDADGGSVYISAGDKANDGAPGEIALIGPLKFAGSDFSASDTAARLTVDGTSYAVAKTIKVKIGSDTYYWPLFGGADAGPAPALSVAFTDLTDVAGAYSGLAGQVPRVNAAADGLTLAPDPGHSVALIAGDGSFFGGPAGMYAGACTGLSDGASIECGGGETTGAAGIGLSTGRGLAAGVKGGDAAITFGESGAGAASARLLIGKTTGDFADANNTQLVTYGAAIGPGGAAISIKRWIPITVDGHAGWIPHFGV